MSLPLNALRVFVSVARRRSIRLAADELCVTPGAVSRQIQGLEAQLGEALFVRGHRSLTPTAAATALLARVAPAFDEIALAVAALRSGGRPPQAVLTVDVTPTFAMHWLIPRLPAFRAAHPEVGLRLVTSQGPVRPSPVVDLHVRRDPGHFSGLDGAAFLAETARLVAVPDFWADPAAAAGDLSGRPLIRMGSRPDLWPRWFAAGDAAANPNFIDFDNTILAIQAACQGLGIALIPTLFLDSLFAEGILATPPLPALASGRYYLLPGRGGSPAAATFADWLRQAAAA